MVKNNIKKCFSLCSLLFIGLVDNIVNASNHTRSISLKSQQCMIEPTLINLHPNEYYSC